jgi:preprotein translocase SecE subunit
MQKFFAFLSEAHVELKKVNWPNRQLLVRYTLLVVGISLLVAAFLGTLDSFFGFLVNRFLLSL